MVRSMRCDECGHIKEFDVIAEAPERCPECGSRWGPNY